MNQIGQLIDGSSAAEELESALSTLNATGSSGISNPENLFRGLGTEISSLFMTLATNPLTDITIGLATGAAFLYDYATAFDNTAEAAQKLNSIKNYYKFQKTLCR